MACFVFISLYVDDGDFDTEIYSSYSVAAASASANARASASIRAKSPLARLSSADGTSLALVGGGGAAYSLFLLASVIWPLTRTPFQANLVEGGGFHVFMSTYRTTD